MDEEPDPTLVRRAEFASAAAAGLAALLLAWPSEVSQVALLPSAFGEPGTPASAVPSLNALGVRATPLLAMVLGLAVGLAGWVLLRSVRGWQQPPVAVASTSAGLLVGAVLWPIDCTAAVDRAAACVSFLALPSPAWFAVAAGLGAAFATGSSLRRRGRR